MDQPGLFFIFRLFKQTIQFLQQINVKKMSNYPSNIRRRDSNPLPYEHESSPITTRPGLPPNPYIVCWLICVAKHAMSHMLQGNINNNYRGRCDRLSASTSSVEKRKTKFKKRWAVDVTQLVERSLPTPEVRGLNPVIVNFYIYFLSTLLKWRK